MNRTNRAHITLASCETVLDNTVEALIAGLISSAVGCGRWTRDNVFWHGTRRPFVDSFQRGWTNQISPRQCLTPDTRDGIRECVCLVVAQPPTTFRSSLPHLFPSLCEPYQDHPSWQISTWKRSRSSGELSCSSLYSFTDLFSSAAEKVEWKRNRPMQPMKTLLRAPEREKKGSSTLRSALATCLPDSAVSRSRKRQNSASGHDSREIQRHSPLVFDGSQDNGGVLRGDGNGEPSEHPADV